MNPLQQLPANVRSFIYLGYTLAVLVVGALAAAYADGQPHWLLVTTRVVAYVGGAVGLTAVSNVGRKAKTEPSA